MTFKANLIKLTYQKSKLFLILGTSLKEIARLRNSLQKIIYTCK